MKQNRKWILILSIVLSVAIAAGGTMAYLQDTDEDVNVMTLGNVYIKQNEQERNDEGVLVQFTQGKPMYPAIYEGDHYPADLPENWPVANDGAWEMTEQNENVIDKIVTVTNTGKSPAYVRTYIAFEGIGEYGPEGGCVHISTNGANVLDKIAAELVGTTQVNGVDYTVYAYTYLQPLAPGETTIPSLKQVYLDKGAGNDEVAYYGETYDILVYSQAVQTEGFADAKTALDEAFGKPAVTNVLWDDMEFPDMIMNYAEKKEAFKANGSYVIGADFGMDNVVVANNGIVVELDLNNHTIIANKKDQYALAAQKGGQLTLNGEGTYEMGYGFCTNKENAQIMVNGGTYITTKAKTLNGILHTSTIQNTSKMVINDGVFKTNVDNAALFMATSNGVLEINGGFFENTVDKTPDLLALGSNKYNNNRVILKGGTFVNYNPMDDVAMYKGEWPESYDAFSGPHMILWDGYEVVSETQENGDIWYTVVKK